jgi:hypothetical protein
MAWTIESLGLVYQDKDPSSHAFNPAVDRIVSPSRMSTEFLRMSMSFPGGSTAALITNRANNVSLDVSCRLTGGTQAGLVRFAGGQFGGSAGDARVTGTPPQFLVTDPDFLPADFSPQWIFSVPTERDLMSVADTVITNAAVFSSATLSGLVYVDAVRMGGTASVTQMNGSGILYVNGNLTLAGGSASLYNGIVIVNGNLNMTGPADIFGATIVQGSVTLLFSGQGVELVYDPGIVNSVIGDLLQYRQNKAAYRVQ